MSACADCVLEAEHRVISAVADLAALVGPYGAARAAFEATKAVHAVHGTVELPQPDPDRKRTPNPADRIAAALDVEPLSAWELSERLGLAPSVVGGHLAALQRADMIRRTGRNRWTTNP